MGNWSVVYQKAYKENNELFFPQKLSHEFLENAKRTMGSYLFANQYLNEIIPSDLQTFKKEWFKYYSQLPKKTNTFIFIDPALSEADTADSTGVVVIKVDVKGDWYVENATRKRFSPTQLLEHIFELNEHYHPTSIGVEEIAFQKVLLYFLAEEMRRRNKVIPVTGIKYPNQKSKQMRILSLVPRFEYNHVFLNQGLQDLELEMLQFPRGAHDDLIDSLAGMEYLAHAPDDRDEVMKKPHSPSDPSYETWYRQNLIRSNNEKADFP